MALGLHSKHSYTIERFDHACQHAVICIGPSSLIKPHRSAYIVSRTWIFNILITVFLRPSTVFIFFDSGYC
jgi:hypothetical protein